jgi:hypothetical protein
VTVARWLGALPWELVDVSDDWLAAVSTVMTAEAAAEHERAIMRARQAKRRQGAAGARLG